MPHQRTGQRELVEMAAENAAETLAGLRAQWEADRSKHVQALAELQAALGLAGPPEPDRVLRHLQPPGDGRRRLDGRLRAGRAGASRLYRRFNIKTVQGQDDFASMEEVLRRRFRRWNLAREEMEKPGGKLDPGFGRLPELLIVDGGKGQLGRALQVVAEAELAGAFAVVGLAKSHEETLPPGTRASRSILPRGSAALHLVQRIRDEAHRVALTQHQTVRQRTGLASQLDAIPGVGPARRRCPLARLRRCRETSVGPRWRN